MNVGLVLGRAIHRLNEHEVLDDYLHLKPYSTFCILIYDMYAFIVNSCMGSNVS
jgi:hypothetical protein